MLKSLKRWWNGQAPYHIELFEGTNTAWLWRLRHNNGQILATSEMYSSRDKARQTAINFARWTGLEVKDQ